MIHTKSFKNQVANVKAEALRYVNAAHEHGYKMVAGKKFNSNREFLKEFTVLVCRRYGMAIIPVDALPELLLKAGPPKNWKDIAMISFINLAKADYEALH